MDTTAPHLQQKNAGNLSDLLKHFWLIELIRKVLSTHRPPKVAYLESHAGAGRYELTAKQLRAIPRLKKKVCPDEAKWTLFDVLNPRIECGLYEGSFVLALRLLGLWKALHPECAIQATLWEKDQVVRTRIQNQFAKLFPANIDSKSISLRGECSPLEFIDTAKDLLADGWTVVWLCDPYWGNTKEQDRQWFQLLNAQCGYGLLFTCVGGNALRHGSDKFDFEKTLGAPRAPAPKLRADGNVSSYGLYGSLSTERFLLRRD